MPKGMWLVVCGCNHSLWPGIRDRPSTSHLEVVQCDCSDLGSDVDVCFILVVILPFQQGCDILPAGASEASPVVRGGLAPLGQVVMHYDFVATSLALWQVSGTC